MPLMGAKLRELRQRRGLGMRELALRSGISHSAISLIERDRMSPSVDTLGAILASLGSTLSAFFEDLDSTLPRRPLLPGRDTDRDRPGRPGLLSAGGHGLSQSAHAAPLRALRPEQRHRRGDGGAGHGIAAVGLGAGAASVDEGPHDLGSAGHSGDRDAAADRLAQGHQIRIEAPKLRGGPAWSRKPISTSSMISSAPCCRARRCRVSR